METINTIVILMIKSCIPQVIYLTRHFGTLPLLLLLMDVEIQNQNVYEIICRDIEIYALLIFLCYIILFLLYIYFY
jgi:hypothetical protein